MSFIVERLSKREPDAVCPETDTKYVPAVLDGEAFCSECRESLAVTRRFLRRPIVVHA